ncbi:ABC transporter substrate-binding protein [Demetria terragena]|uniref:ABC transporter substrate-binding protein n=1 Tax=Demetria terragena TaxID=63959 RepID=UPI001B7FAF0C|nr:ABC transporter substrate-binding protein [Demetria terragena]
MRRLVALRAGTTAVTVAMLLVACSPVQQRSEPPDRADLTEVSADGVSVRKGGDLAIALAGDADVLDPTTSSSLNTRNIMSSFCEKLYDIDAKGRIVPQLATALPAMSEQGRVLRISLRKGVKFADGTTFNAQAVRTSLNRHLTKKDSARAGEIGPVTSVKVVNTHTIEMRFEKPFAPTVAALADRAGMIMSPKALARLGDNFGDAPVCVGAFKFKKRVPATSVVVTKDPNYYAADQIHLDSITYRVMVDANIRAANLQSGDVQVVDTTSTASVDWLRKRPGTGLLQVGSLGYQSVILNSASKKPAYAKSPLRDSRVRQALELSLDRKALVNSVFDNWYEPACSPISPDSPYATPASNACSTPDPKKSRALLKDAGFKTPVKVSMKVTNSPDVLRLAQAIQGSVSKGGFELTIEPVEFTTLLDDTSTGNFEIAQLGWSGRVDPHGNMAAFLTTKAPNNYGSYSNKDVDALMVKAAQATTTSKRSKIYGRIVQQVQKDDPLIYLYRQRSLTTYSTKVVGIRAYADGVIRLDRAGYRAGAAD